VLGADRHLELADLAVEPGASRAGRRAALGSAVVTLLLRFLRVLPPDVRWRLKNRVCHW
jgi:hypothetical protein